MGIVKVCLEANKPLTLQETQCVLYGHIYAGKRGFSLQLSAAEEEPVDEQLCKENVLWPLKWLGIACDFEDGLYGLQQSKNRHRKYLELLCQLSMLAGKLRQEAEKTYLLSAAGKELLLKTGDRINPLAAAIFTDILLAADVVVVAEAAEEYEFWTAEITNLLGRKRPEVLLVPPMLPELGESALEHYHQQGYLPEGVKHFLTAAGNSSDCNPDWQGDMVWFSFEAAAANKEILTVDKLNQINAKYMEACTSEQIAFMAMPYLVAEGRISHRLSMPEMRELVTKIQGLRGRLHYAGEVVKLAAEAKI